MAWLLPASLDARYRVYNLVIKDVTSDEEHEVKTTLSPEVYYMYYEINRKFRKISVKSTWMCWGDTSNFKPLCEDPRE